MKEQRLNITTEVGPHQRETFLGLYLQETAKQNVKAT